MASQKANLTPVGVKVQVHSLASQTTLTILHLPYHLIPKVQRETVLCSLATQRCSTPFHSQSE